MTVRGGVGLSSTHPASLQADWSLQYGKPLIISGRGGGGADYLSCIFISSLMGARPWQYTWSAQILSVLAWAQVGLASNYARMAVMRALHKAVCRVYAASPWTAENTMRAVYAIAHHQPCTQHTVVTRLIHWLHKNAHWHGTLYTDTTVPAEFQLEDYEPMWCADINLLPARGTP